MTKNSIYTIVAIAIVVALIAGVKYYKTKNPNSVTPENNEYGFNEPTQTPMPQAKQYSTPPPLAINKNKKYIATINTSKGAMKFELFAKETPITVNNFVFLAKEKFYDGIKFHRIIKDFMIQSGDPQGTGMGGPGYQFNDEPITRDYKRGIMAMANSGPNSNGSQFFIMHKDGSLPKKYVIFGQLIEGFDALDKIAASPVVLNSSGEKSSPTENILINSITIEEK